MNKNRIVGAAEQAEGALKEITGKVIGDAKLIADGKAEKARGKIRNAIGGIEETAKT